TDIGAGMELGAALAHDDRASRNQFTTVTLDTQHLWLGVASVARRAAAFFLCHLAFSLSRDRGDFDFGEILPVTLALLIVLATAHLEDADFVVAAVSHHFDRD